MGKRPKSNAKSNRGKSQKSQSGKPQGGKSSKTPAVVPQASLVTPPLADPWLTIGLAWFVPGLGHAFLGRRGRGLVFFCIILAALLIGVIIEGRLPWQFSGSPLSILASLGALGSGLLCLILRFGFGYEGDMTAAGYEYGGAFILSAGLMNLLLVLDAWDIVWGKELASPDEPTDEATADDTSETETEDEA